MKANNVFISEVLKTHPSHLEHRFGNNIKGVERRMVKIANQRLSRLTAKGYDRPKSISDFTNKKGNFTMSKTGDSKSNITVIREYMISEYSSLTKLNKNKSILESKLGKKIDVQTHNKYLFKMSGMWDKIKEVYQQTQITSDQVFDSVQEKVQMDGSTFDQAFAEVYEDVMDKYKSELVRIQSIEDEYTKATKTIDDIISKRQGK